MLPHLKKEPGTCNFFNLSPYVYLFLSLECRYTGFGIPVPHRPVEDLAYGVARFIQKGGSFVNYYMVTEPSTSS